MTDPQTGSKPVRAATTSGGEVFLPKLSPRQIIAFGNELLEARRTRLKQNCTESGVDANATAEKLNAFDSRSITRLDTLEYINTLIGQAHVASYALNGEADELDPSDLYRVAAERLGFQMKAVTGDTKDPPAGGGSTSPTGSPTPPA
jgi:hypothetical protein